MRGKHALLLAGLVPFVACTDSESPAGPDPAPLPDIPTFVADSPFPEKQPTEVTAIPAAGEVWLFVVAYGVGHDCWSGCYYSRAWGLRSGDRIAWFHLEDYEGGGYPEIALYDLGPEDANLLRAESFAALQVADDWFYRFALLLRVAESEDIGTDPLQHAIQSLYGYYHPQLARLLIANEVVRSDPDLLLALAELPDLGRGYDEVRDEAQQLLGL